MSFDTYWRFVGALVLVIALIFVVAWIARRYGLAGRLATPRGKRRLSVLEVLPLDGKRRLVLLRRDSTEYLVLLGLTTDLVVESGIRAEDFASKLEGTG